LTPASKRFKQLKAFLVMRFGSTSSQRTVRVFHRDVGWGFSRNPIKSLGGLSVFLAMFAINLVDGHAVMQPTARKDTVKNTSGAVTPSVRKTPTAKKPLLRSPLPELIDPLERREHTLHRVRQGETLDDMLRRYSLPEAEKQLWLRSLTRELGRRPLPVGTEVHLHFAKPTLTRAKPGIPGRLKALEFDQDSAFTLTWEKGIRGILFQRQEKPYEVEIKSVSAEVESSLFEDGRKAGVHPALLSQLVDIFTWDIDLGKAVGRGDTFKILYEQRNRKGQESRSALRILAAELNNAGQKLTAIYFEKQEGRGNYYNLEGRSLERSFLRFPLEFTSITSHFTDSRFHPILKTNLPHMGVDFAARRGTPVRAVGDGVISEAGWNGNYGKAIDIKHDSIYTSRYAHLQGFAPGIRGGVNVTKGQIIGYVGTTGRSTGPHLHFELYKDQQFIDPLSIDFPAEDSIDPALQKVFESQTRTYLVELSALSQASFPHS
jgi:murein DD-endopeptidase MepM/ murein hydrolase activator NlpD